MIVEKVELEPFTPLSVDGAGLPDPPDPTVIGKDVAVTVTLLGALG